MEVVIKKVVDWLKKYSEDNNNFCFVVGISGGIDSATVSTLCAETGISTHVVSLPIHQNTDQIELANQHIKDLKVKYNNIIPHYIDLSNNFDMIKNTLINYNNPLSWANTKSRLRMVTLYHIASFNNGLVVGTGNKIEDFGIGFFTKYGDGGVDISPIADFTKTEVRKMAKILGVNEQIIKVKPTDGLWDDDRTDEDQIGATYEELEWAMNYLENGHNYSLSERQNNILNISNKFHAANMHKMISIPIFKK